MKNYENLKNQEIAVDPYSVPSFDDVPKVPLSLLFLGKYKESAAVNESTINQVRKKNGGGTYMHKAIDVVCKVGTEIFSPGTGIVSEVKPNNGGAGNALYLYFPESRITIAFFHLSGFNVKAKQSVATGDLIALSGNTGHSTGPHLHIEAKRDGVKLDPLSLFQLDIKVIP